MLTDIEDNLISVSNLEHYTVTLTWGLITYADCIFMVASCDKHTSSSFIFLLDTPTGSVLTQDESVLWMVDKISSIVERVWDLQDS